jgi:putative phosphoribosyl transferase
MNKFIDRRRAGMLLAQQLKNYANRPDVIILSLPRGGVPVGFEVAHFLRVPLDVFIVRKLGAPLHTELAMGAIASGNTRVLNQNVILDCKVSDSELAAVEALERTELQRREKIYRGDRAPLDLQHKVVILVDDGIATGSTMRAAITAIKQAGPASIIVAVPLGPRDTIADLKNQVDEMICLIKPFNFYAVGAHYEQFNQTTDQEVCDLLAKSASLL